VEDKLGCIYEESFVLVDVPSIEAYMENTVTLDLGDEYVLNLETNLNIDEIDSIVWSPDDLLSCNNCFNPSFIAENNIVYHAIVYDIYGCFDEVEISVRVVLDEKVYIPNIFSPNGDGVNDFVTVFGKESQISEVNYFAIFDRWGNRVFENVHFALNDPNSGWDGKFNERNASLGVYAYVAIVELINGERVTIGGDVTLIR
jgi:gliding motility-associated-like protein